MNRSVLKVSRLLSVLAVVGMLWLPAQVLALSVNTNDIVDGAVTTPKIATGAIDSSKIAASAVTNSGLADGSVTDAKLGVGAVTSSKIADGAVVTGSIAAGAITDDKITGPISGSKLGAHSHDGADIIDGTINGSKLADGSITSQKLSVNIAPNKIKTYSNIKVVHKGEVDLINTFNSVSSALASITDAGPENQYLIYVMPGIYVDTFTTIPYVNIVGSNKAITKITSINTSDPPLGTVKFDSAATIENLTIESTASDTAPAAAITSTYSYNGNALIKNCALNAVAASGYSWGIRGFGQSMVVTDTEITSTSQSGGAEGVTSFAGNLSMVNSSVKAQSPTYTIGLYPYGSQATIVNSKIEAANGYSPTAVLPSTSNLTFKESVIVGMYYVWPIGSNSTVRFFNSQLIGGRLGSGTFKLVNNIDADFNPIPNQ